MDAQYVTIHSHTYNNVPFTLVFFVTTKTSSGKKEHPSSTKAGRQTAKLSGVGSIHILRGAITVYVLHPTFQFQNLHLKVHHHLGNLRVLAFFEQ